MASEFLWVEICLVHRRRKDYCQSGEYRFALSRRTELLSFPYQIHLKNLMDLNNFVFDDALKAGNRPLDTSPYTRYYLPVAHLMVWKTVVNTQARAFYERGKLTKLEGQKAST